MNFIKNDLYASLLISVLYLIIFVSAEIWRKVKNPEPEITRKFVHFSCGSIALSFSYLFSSHWTVLILGIGFIIILWLTKRFGLLDSVHKVERKSVGGIYFPIAVYTTFFISQKFNQPHFYLISILILAVSDSLAAIIGSYYGKKLYKVNEDFKSFAGSTIFFLSSYIIISTGLLLLTDFPKEKVLIVSVYISILVTGFEAISWGGTDNIYIPLGTIFLLNKILDKSYQHTAMQILYMFIVFMIFFFISKANRKISNSGVLGISLLGYGAWSLLDFSRFIPVLIGVIMISFSDLFVRKIKEKSRKYPVRSVFYILGVSLIWILLNNKFKQYDKAFLTPYLLIFTSNLSIFWSKHKPLPNSNKFIQFLNEKNIYFRAIILALIFLLPQLFYYRNMNFILSFVILALGTYLFDISYHFFGKHYVKRDLRVILRFGFLNLFLISSLIFGFNMLFFKHL